MSQMTYQYPQALYLLFLIPLLVILYFIKTKRVEDYYTPVYFLWAKLAEQTRAKTLLQQLLRNLILLFQLLIVTFLILALSKPRFAGELDSRKPIVLVVDNSASMNTVEGGVTRLQQAKKRALGLLDNLQNRQVMLTSTVRRDERTPSITSDRVQLAAYVNNIPPTDGADDFLILIPYLISFCKEPPQIYVISDAAGSGIAELLDIYADLNFVRVGEGGDNIAITGLEARRNPLLRGEYQVMIKLGNFSSHPRHITIETSLENDKLEAKEVDLAAGEQATLIIDGEGGYGGVIHSRILVDDALIADNQAYAILKPRHDISLLMVNVTDKYLKRALGVLDRVRVISLSRREYRQMLLLTPYARFDMGVFCGFTPKSYLSRHNLIINPGGTSPVKINSPISWSSDHPVMKYLELSHMQLKRANSLKLKPRSQVLLQAGDAPLLVYDTWDGFSLLQLGFALEDSDLRLRPAFPMFLLNVINFFSSRQSPRDLIKLKVGQPYLIPILSGQLREDKTGHIITPKGDRIPVELHKGEENFYRPLMSGRYEFVLEGFRSSFIVGLDEGESQIAPSDLLPSSIVWDELWGGWGSYIRLWQILALLALGLIVFEWWYQREKMDALY